VASIKGQHYIINLDFL
jgi:hypothetical protein